MEAAGEGGGAGSRALATRRFRSLAQQAISARAGPGPAAPEVAKTRHARSWNRRLGRTVVAPAPRRESRARADAGRMRRGNRARVAAAIRRRNARVVDPRAPAGAVAIHLLAAQAAGNARGSAPRVFRAGTLRRAIRD